MPALTWKRRTIYSTEGGQQFDYTETVTGGDGDINEQVSVPASTTQEVDLVFAFANIKGYILLADKNCVLKTNSSGSPDETITLVAGVPQFYPGGTNLFGHDVTKIFVVNGVGAVANVSIEVLLDTTP